MGMVRKRRMGSVAGSVLTRLCRSGNTNTTSWRASSAGSTPFRMKWRTMMSWSTKTAILAMANRQSYNARAAGTYNGGRHDARFPAGPFRGHSRPARPPARPSFHRDRGGTGGRARDPLGHAERLLRIGGRELPGRARGAAPGGGLERAIPGPLLREHE